MNSVNLFGNIGNVKDLMEFKDGGAKLSFSLATTYRKKVGESYENAADWHNCVIGGARAKGLAPHLVKGLQLAIHGSMRTREYEHNGDKRWITEVIVKDVDFGKPPKDSPARTRGGSYDEVFDNDRGAAAPTTDDIPF